MGWARRCCCLCDKLAGEQCTAWQDWVICSSRGWQQVVCKKYME